MAAGFNTGCLGDKLAQRKPSKELHRACSIKCAKLIICSMANQIFFSIIYHRKKNAFAPQVFLALILQLLTSINMLQAAGKISAWFAT